MLLPILWETSATPEFGDRPQAIVNRQLVDTADLLISTFWTRLGTPTGIAQSGTVEEIERFIESNRPVMLYFSNAPTSPHNLDQEQLTAVKHFRADIRKRGLATDYDSVEHLESKPGSTENSLRLKAG